MANLKILTGAGNLASTFGTNQLAFNLGFDEITGSDVYDFSSANRNFVTVGAGITRPLGVNGNGGSSMKSTGTSYVRATDILYGNTSTYNFSMATWIKPDTTNYANPICSKGDFGSTNSLWTISIMSGIGVQWQVYAGFHMSSGDVLIAHNTSGLTAGTLAHITFTIERTSNGITVNYYLNGNLYNTNNATGIYKPYTGYTLSNANYFKLFTGYTASTYYGWHTLDDFWFFNNKLLTAEEVWELYQVMK